MSSAEVSVLERAVPWTMIVGSVYGARVFTVWAPDPRTADELVSSHPAVFSGIGEWIAPPPEVVALQL